MCRYLTRTVVIDQLQHRGWNCDRTAVVTEIRLVTVCWLTHVWRQNQ